MSLVRTIPAMPVRDIAAAVTCYVEKFGFTAVHQDSGFAVVMRDDVRVNLWEASDDSWRPRPGADPVRSGAESFIAGTASFRVEVTDVDGLYAELAAAGVLHYRDGGAPVQTDFGTYEFATTDVDGNLIEFYRWVSTGG
ncbi:MAG: VOC family protein [Geodermatophilaceae bacterium]|nr:VOC family protein [Geodermatophilaceae bacterium]